LKGEQAVAVLVLLGCALRTAWAADLTVNLTDANGKPVENAVVYAEPIGRPLPAPHASHAIIDQVNKRFVPAVNIIRTGTEVLFPNRDNFRHSIYSFSPAKVFTVKLYSGKQAPPVVFDKPGLVILGCNIHDIMAAWVVVVDTPYFGKSAAGGAAVIKDLEPGAYKLSAWYPAPTFVPVVSQVHVGGEPVTARMKVEVTASPLLPGIP
jgi:plastocyanin